jgi:hypothetical protein
MKFLVNASSASRPREFRGPPCGGLPGDQRVLPLKLFFIFIFIFYLCFEALPVADFLEINESCP